MKLLHRLVIGFCVGLSVGLRLVAASAAEPGKVTESAAPRTQTAPSSTAAAVASGVPSASAPPAAAATATAGGSNPHEKTEVKDISIDVPEIPPGTIEVLLRNSEEGPIAGTSVQLDVLRASIAEGDSRSSRTAISDENGRAVFSDLGTTTDYSYRAVVKVEPAQFGSGQFQLRPDMGHRQTLHIFPITRSQGDAHVVGRGVMAVHPQDDVFLVDILYQLINLGDVAWVPEDVSLKLPEGWKAFTTQDATSPTRFDQNDPIGAKLVGTFQPGAHEVGFRFQVTNPHNESAAFRLPLLPRTIQMRVIVEASPEMSLTVPSFDAAFIDRMRTGERVLVAEKSYLNRRENSPESLSVNISGMRTKGYGHIVALAIALSIPLLGFLLSLMIPRETKQLTALNPEDLAHARKLLLDELMELERAREKKIIGVKAYQHTRQVLITSLARLMS